MEHLWSGMELSYPACWPERYCAGEPESPLGSVDQRRVGGGDRSSSVIAHLDPRREREPAALAVFQYNLEVASDIRFLKLDLLTVELARLEDAERGDPNRLLIGSIERAKDLEPAPAIRAHGLTNSALRDLIVEVGRQGRRRTDGDGNDAGFCATRGDPFELRQLEFRQGDRAGV